MVNESRVAGLLTDILYYGVKGVFYGEYTTPPIPGKSPGSRLRFSVNGDSYLKSVELAHYAGAHSLLYDVGDIES